MIARVTRPSLKLQEEPNTLNIPRSSKTIPLRAAFEKSPSKPRTNKLFKAIESRCTEISTLKYESSRLREAIILEMKKRKKGAQLNLCGEATRAVETYFPCKGGEGGCLPRREGYTCTEGRAREEARKIQRAITATENK